MCARYDGGSGGSIGRELFNPTGGKCVSPLGNTRVRSPGNREKSDGTRIVSHLVLQQVFSENTVKYVLYRRFISKEWRAVQRTKPGRKSHGSCFALTFIDEKKTYKKGYRRIQFGSYTLFLQIYWNSNWTPPKKKNNNTYIIYIHTFGNENYV